MTRNRVLRGAMVLAGLTVLTTALSAHAQTQAPVAEPTLPAAWNPSSDDRSSSDLDHATRVSWSELPAQPGTKDDANPPQAPVVPEPQAVLFLAGGAVLLAMKRTKTN